MSYLINDVAVGVVTHNSEKMAHFFSSTGAMCRNLFIVDNASSDETVALFRQKMPHAVVFELEKNIGFGPANNVGFAEAAKVCKYVLFINPDCRIPHESVNKLIHTLRMNTSVAIACPVVTDEKGKRHPILARDYTKGYAESKAQEVHASGELPDFISGACIQGSCMLVDVEKFTLIGGFNTSIFMYCEEDDLHLRLIKNNYTTTTNTTAIVIHLGGASSTPTLRVALRKAYHARWSKNYVVKNYVGKWRSLSMASVTLVLAPLAILISLFMLSKRNTIKWTGWFLASIDTILGKRILGDSL